MESIYFIDDEHSLFYQGLLIKWNQAFSNTEYQTAIYILSVPMIYHKIKRYLFNFEEPVDWIWNWEWYYNLTQNDQYYKGSDRGEQPKYDLTGSMVHMGRFALNMWNGYEHFNLMDCIKSLDERHFMVIKCGVEMRRGNFRHRVGEFGYKQIKTDFDNGKKVVILDEKRLERKGIT